MSAAIAEREECISRQASDRVVSPAAELLQRNVEATEVLGHIGSRPFEKRHVGG